MLAPILNGCGGNMTEMTRRRNKVVGVVRRAIQKYMTERLLSKIGDNPVIQEEDLSEEVRSLRPDLNFVKRSFGSSHAILIDSSCLSRRISSGTNTRETVHIDKKEKYSKLAQDINNIREMHVEIISMTFSSRGIVSAKSVEAVGNLLVCDSNEMKKIGRRL
jgi:hypothetical protein